MVFRGPRALTAAGVPEAARVFPANRPDVLVLVSATQKPGTKTVSDWVDAEPGLCGVPVLVLTGLSGRIDDPGLAWHGFDTLTPKPISVPSLSRSISAVPT